MLSFTGRHVAAAVLIAMHIPVFWGLRILVSETLDEVRGRGSSDG